MLGVGTLGSIFAARILDAGVALTLFDLDARQIEPFVERGVRVATDVADLVRDADIVLVSLPNPVATQQAVLGPSGVIAACRPGTLIIDTSTIDPTTAREVARQAAANNVDYVEAPLSGGDEEGSGVDAARAGAATFICGGTAEAVERARPLLNILGRHILHVGPAGTGATAKLVSNHMAGLHNLVAAEALAVGRAGLSLDTMLEVLRHTDAQSYWLFNYLAPRLARQTSTTGSRSTCSTRTIGCSANSPRSTTHQRRSTIWRCSCTRRCAPTDSAARTSPRPPTWLASRPG